MKRKKKKKMHILKINVSDVAIYSLRVLHETAGKETTNYKK